MTNDYGNLELHKVLLATMKDIDKICQENNLKYYLHAGTLLGAFNHKGFIPWDDDVDISLMRDDYEKFIQIVMEQYSGKYFLQNYKTDDSYTNNRSILRVLGTEMFYEHEKGDITHREIGVDIVPLDAVPKYKINRKIQQGAIWLFDVAVQIKQGAIIPQSILMKCIGILSRIPRKKLGGIIDKITTHYNKHNTEYVGLLSYTGRNPYTGRSGYENDIMPRIWFENPVLIDFEDTKFMTISDAEKDLIHRYGPMWAAPYPEEKRTTKHDVISYMISSEVRERVGL